ncbi:MAG: hypothetical protein Q4D57_01245 [Clostridia bacterium]|nr:hypothetical protein [Clostridia bacterium]
MSRKFLKVLSCALLSISMLGTAGVLTTYGANAQSNVCQGGNCASSDVHVADANSFAVAVSNASNGSTIVLDRDIVLDRNVEIRSSVTLDLDGHSILLSRGAQIKVGAKIYNHTEYYTVDHPGYYTTERKVTYISNPDLAVYDAYGNFLYYEHVPDTEVVSYENVWHDGWTETKSRNVYDYLDHLDVVFMDGNIVGGPGKSGADGVEDTFTDCDGKRGNDGFEAVSIVSGTLRLRNITITGGNGGNGGDGKYQAILHIPFFTGNGGDGGDGGNAGAAVILERKGANLVQEKSVVLKCGTPGHGGKGGPANKNHWVGKGKDGKNGKEGKPVAAIQK